MEKILQTELLEEKKGEKKNIPLAKRMQPQHFEEIAGQSHILGKNALLPKIVRENAFSGLLFYGPPGCGKTTLARVIANTTQSHFVPINAVLSNVAELRDILKIARSRQEQTILFIDEIHRFNKAQQDLLLPDVEAGHITLIGATTHSPGFYIIPALVSRCHVFRLEPIETNDIVKILKIALKNKTIGLGNTLCSADNTVLQQIANMSDGDLRRALNALEMLVLTQPMGTTLTEEHVKTFAEERHLRYDKNEDEHYDTISAYIKSIRGNDPDAAIYWMTRMLEGGEDPRFIARRLFILASEDVGLADSRALTLASATYHACEVIGIPECAINLAHATIFMATAPKSNSAYMAYRNAQKALREQPIQSVPLHLRDASTKMSKSLGYGKDYLYSHDFPENISGQNYLNSPLHLYSPKNSGTETHIAERLKHWKSLKS